MSGVIAAFRELDSAVDAIEDLKKERLGEITVYSPTPRHELEHADRCAAKPREAIHALRRSVRCDMRILDRGVGVRLLAAGRRRQAGRIVGSLYHFRI